VLTPTLSRVTPELGWLDPSQSFETVMGRLLEWVCFTPLQNATGDPAISLPMGMSSKGLPIGVQLAAERGHDRRLLQVAYELEAAQPFARIQDRIQEIEDQG
jgi:amidase